MLAQIIGGCVSIIVALVGIIPTVIANRKKTEASIRESDEQVKKNLAEVKSTLDAHIREDEEDRIRTKRYRILRFYDEMCEGKRHSESHFEDVLEDIDDYKQFCETHPSFKNSRGHAAMVAICDAYPRIKATGGFLIDERSKNND